VLERLTNADISSALDEMVMSVGVKEELPFASLVATLGTGNTQGCIQEIASCLGLPILVNVSYVSKDFKSGNSSGFRSSELSRTDWSGHGIDGIPAQVSILASLPLYGSSSPDTQSTFASGKAVRNALKRSSPSWPTNCPTCYCGRSGTRRVIANCTRT
jgi:hypothetical protein